MRVTIKGQVTIPQHIREKLGITPATDIEFVEDLMTRDVSRYRTYFPTVR